MKLLQTRICSRPGCKNTLSRKALRYCSRECYHSERVPVGVCRRNHPLSYRENGSSYCAKCKRANYFASHYGIPHEVVLAFDEPEVCKICGDDVELVLDHDHATKKLRGWLCVYCNRGLGQFRDDPDLLLKAVTYLENSRLGS